MCPATKLAKQRIERLFREGRGTFAFLLGSAKAPDQRAWLTETHSAVPKADTVGAVPIIA
jgi:hypothetical protein